MNRIKVLDCTLRDGGYVNDFEFGRPVIKDIIHKLTEANVDFCECGFLEDVAPAPDRTVFGSVEDIGAFLPEQRKNTRFVAMMVLGKYDVARLPRRTGKTIDGIRVSFHIHEVREGLDLCARIKDLGYQVFVQPVGTTSYSAMQLLELVQQVNRIEPFAFYLVDTLGVLRASELLRLFHLVDGNLARGIHLGFHSHNNLQLSFSNGQELARVHTKRRLILDSSIYGMGRGAGNLNTELIVAYLNEQHDSEYWIDPLLEIMDDHFGTLRQKYSWGYAVPYSLAAHGNCHPNYATYFMNRKTLAAGAIHTIMRGMRDDKRELYDEKYAEELYTAYQENRVDDSGSLAALKARFSGRTALLLAPGSTLTTHREAVLGIIERDQPVIVSINSIIDDYPVDLVFFGNSKRFSAIEPSVLTRRELILTSNVKPTEAVNACIVNYSGLNVFGGIISDNSTLMCIQLLSKLGVSQVLVAGFDGYRPERESNYFDGRLDNVLPAETMVEMNREISRAIDRLAARVPLVIVTPSAYREQAREDR